MYTRLVNYMVAARCYEFYKRGCIFSYTWTYSSVRLRAIRNLCNFSSGRRGHRNSEVISGDWMQWDVKFAAEYTLVSVDLRFWTL